MYLARDIVTGKCLAVKLDNPVDAALVKAKERGWTPAVRHKKENVAGYEPFSNYLPTIPMISEGVPFTVMKWIRDSLDLDYLREDLPSSERYATELKLLSASDRVSLFETMLKGIAEFHSLGSVHQDVKAENIRVFRNEKGNLEAILTDSGVATDGRVENQSTKNSGHFGYVLTRSPGMFIDDVHPRQSMDVFSVGALAYRLFTGEYPFEREIKALEASEKNETALERKLDEFMHQFVSLTRDAQGKATYSLKEKELSAVLDEKLSDRRIPKPFQRVIRNCLLEKYSNGSEAVEGFEREMKLAKRKRAASWIGAGASALFLAGAGLMYCFAPSPLRVPTDFETLPLEKKSIVVTAECEYDDVAGFFRFGNYDILLEKEYWKFPENEELDQLLLNVPEPVKKEILDEVRTRVQTLSPVKSVSSVQVTANRRYDLIVALALPDERKRERVRTLTDSLKVAYAHLIRTDALFPELRVDPGFYTSLQEDLSNKIASQQGKRMPVDVLLREILNCGDLFHVNVLPEGYDVRYNSLDQRVSKDGATLLHKLQVILAESVKHNTLPSGDVDFENVLVEWLVGGDVLQMAKSIAKSAEYRIYVNAQKQSEGDFVIPLAKQSALHTLYNGMAQYGSSSLRVQCGNKSLSVYTIPTTPEAEVSCRKSYAPIARLEYELEKVNMQQEEDAVILFGTLSEEEKRKRVARLESYDVSRRILSDATRKYVAELSSFFGVSGEVYSPEKKKFIDKWRSEVFEEKRREEKESELIQQELPVEER